MNKILIIGQAPASNPQQVPYDTTMLYDWLSECGISKDQAQSMFEFEAVSNVFPGFDKNGGHLKPSSEAMQRHWLNTLEPKIQMADRVILLGKVASEYYNNRPRTWSCSTTELELMHPSKRNYRLYIKNKQEVIEKLKSFLL